MKKIIGLIMALGLFSLSASAAVGDIAVNIYSTDIMADIDGMAIPSYNIGGKTVIIAEELVSYGFDVVWDNDARTLDIYTGKLPVNPVMAEIEKSEIIGKVVGNIYETDIITRFNNMYVEAYNLGGRTAVVIEDMANTSDEKQMSRDNNIFEKLGMSIAGAGALWDGEARTVSLCCLRPGSYMNVDGEDYLIKGDYIKTSDYHITGISLFDENGERITEWVNANLHGNKVYIPLEVAEKYKGQKLFCSYATSRGSTYNNLLYLECSDYDAYYYKGDIMVDFTENLEFLNN